jgi:predicted lipoprotein with Yx(FWY)xxD motif
MRKTLVAGFLSVLAVAACGGAASPSPSVAAPTTPASVTPASETPSTAPPTETASASASATTTGAATVMVAGSDLGQILVDGEGRTLYLFIPDEAAGKPTCYDACAASWPPLLAEGEITVGEGLDDSDFSTATRTDGGEQVKVGTWPLYYFANDAAPGDTNGQGLNDVWFVVSPAGEAIR